MTKPAPSLTESTTPATKGVIMRTLIATTLAASALFIGAPAAQAAPCKFPATATWCAPRDGSDSNGTRQAGDHLDRPSAKTSAGDGTEPAIKFRIPGWKLPTSAPKTGAGDGNTPAIRFR